MRLIQLEPDLLEDGLGVCSEHRVLPVLDQPLVQLVDIRQIEVPQDHERLGLHGVRRRYG